MDNQEVARVAVQGLGCCQLTDGFIWVVVKVIVPFWIPIIIRHLIFRVPTRNHNFDNHPYTCFEFWAQGLGCQNPASTKVPSTLGGIGVQYTNLVGLWSPLKTKLSI